MNLDKQIAVEVMWWKESDLGEMPGSSDYHWVKPNTESSSPMFVTAYGNNFNPSTNISDAYEVVRHLINEHSILSFDIHCLIPNSDPVMWYVDIKTKTRKNVNGQDFDLEKAICLAALEAIK